jgi:hypothetical protein
MPGMSPGEVASRLGIDADGLAYPLHQPTAHRCQTRGHGLLPGVVLLLQWAVAPFGGCEPSPPPSSVDIDGELSASMPALLNPTWGKSFVP